MGRLVHFEIHSAEPERAIRFYETVFGWSAERWGEQPYWLLTTGEEGSPGINGAITQRRGPVPEDGQPVNAMVCTIEVDDLDGHLAKVGAQGGAIVLPRMPVPGVGWLAYARDPDGNLFGLMESDPTAPEPAS